MTQKSIFNITDFASEVHERIAGEGLLMQPVFEIRQNMRDSGFAADLLTIDCHKTRKRILCVFHDDKADTVLKENGFMDQEPKMVFDEVRLDSITADVLYGWVVSYFV